MSKQTLKPRMAHASSTVVSQAAPVLMLLASLSVLTYVTAVSPPLPNLVCAQDLGFIIDAGYRFYQGQIAHLDYRSPIGPALGVFVGLPLIAFGAEYESLKFLPIATTWIFSLWSLLLTWRLIGPSLACLFAFAVGLYGGGLFHLGFAPEALTFAVYYNRLGFGLLTIGMIALIQRPDGVSPSVGRYLSFGMAAALLLFLKINFAFFLAIAAGIQMLLGAVSRVDSYRFALAAIGCVAIAGASIQFRFDLMLDDLARAAAARSTIADRLFFPLRNLLANLDVALLAAVLASLGPPLAKGLFRISHASFSRWAVQCVAPFLIGYGITLMQSHGDGRLVLPALVGFVFAVATYKAADVGAALQYDPAAIRAVKALLAGACIIFIIPHVAAYNALYKCRALTGSQVFEASSLKGLIVGEFNSWGPEFVSRINEATRLVERNVPSDSTIEYIDMGNMITFATRRPSAEGAAYVWDNSSTISMADPLPTSAFDAVQHLLLPKGISVQSQEVFYQLYGEMLRKDYAVIEESENFILLRRASPPHQ